MKKRCILMTLFATAKRTLAFTTARCMAAAPCVLSHQSQGLKGKGRCQFQIAAPSTGFYHHYQAGYNSRKIRRCFATTDCTVDAGEGGKLDNMTGRSVVDVLHTSVRWLNDRNISEPTSSATQLLAEVLGLPWENGFAQLRNIHDGSWNDEILAQRSLTQIEWDLFWSMLKRRSKHEPIQYILGKWDFLDFTLSIQAPLLCPRPETEELVNHVIADAKLLYKRNNGQPLRILDVGCGTGVIGIALAKALGSSIVKSIVAIDIEPIAVEISNRNAMDILPPEKQQVYQAILSAAGEFNSTGFDIVVSNPPYIPQSDMPTLSADVVNYESSDALCGGDDGMDVIRVIVASLKQWCPDGGICWMEVDPSHPALLKEWLDGDRKNCGVDFIDSCQDLCGRERFVKLQYLPNR